MKNDLVTDVQLRQFLLAQLGEEEQERIERLFITDAQFQDRVLAVEQELIDNYLDDSLSSEDRVKFVSQYGDTPARQKTLKIASLIRDWARREAASEISQKTLPDSGFVLRPWAPLKPFWLVPIAITSIVAIVVVGVWYAKNSQERKRSVTIEQQIQELNQAAISRTISVSSTLTLAPISVRSAEPLAKFSAQTEGRVVELRLLWMQKQVYATYLATIRGGGDNPSITVRNLRAGLGGYISLLLPQAALSSGEYRIELSGLNNDGTVGPSEEFKFAVTE